MNLYSSSFIFSDSAKCIVSALPKRELSAFSAAQSIITKELDGIKAAGTWKNERVIVTKQAADVKVQGSNSSVINFCANNYLGLSVSICKKITYSL